MRPSAPSLRALKVWRAAPLLALAAWRCRRLVLGGGGEPRPIRHLQASQGLAAAAVRLEDRRLAFLHLEPILAEGVENVRLVGDDHDVGSGGRNGTGELAEGLRPPIV